jgi:hypothetical protein
MISLLCATVRRTPQGYPYPDAPCEVALDAVEAFGKMDRWGDSIVRFFVQTKYGSEFVVRPLSLQPPAARFWIKAMSKHMRDAGIVPLATRESGFDLRWFDVRLAARKNDNTEATK